MNNLRNTYKPSDLHEQWQAVYKVDLNQRKFDDVMMKRLMTYLKGSKDALFLDAGCGAGDHCVRIGQSGYRCIGLDFSEYALSDAYRYMLSAKPQGCITFCLGALQHIPFRDNEFDAIHCRGVLMHIPEWKKALSELCRVLRTGGRIAIVESNDQSLESLIVRGVRKVIKTRSKLIKTDDGLEFWSGQEQNPFLVRVANVKSLRHQLQLHNVKIIKVLATEFWDINRFPAGVLRKSTIYFNRLYFHINLLRRWSSGNVIIGEKI